MLPIDTTMTLIDLAPRAHTIEFRKLLLTLVGWRENAAANQRVADEVIQAYQHEPGLHLLGVETSVGLHGIIGLHIDGTYHGVIRHIVVDAGIQQRGFGRAAWVTDTCATR